MHQYLYKYLVLNRKLSIPGLGFFSIINEPSQIDKVNGLIFPPKPIMRFEINESAENDLQLINFLREEMNIDEELANKEFQNFSTVFIRNLQEQNLAILPGVGRLNKGSNGNIRFTAETNLLEFLPPLDIEKSNNVSSTKIIKPKVPEISETKAFIPNEEVERDVKDNWWIYALALFILGTIALLMYS